MPSGFFTAAMLTVVVLMRLGLLKRLKNLHNRDTVHFCTPLSLSHPRRAVPAGCTFITPR